MEQEPIKGADEPKGDDYILSEEDKESIAGVYKDFEKMRDERNKKYGFFNDRTLIEFVNDSVKRTNGYVPTREQQGKEGWQANVFRPDTRNKLKAILAATATDIPPVDITAQNENGMRDIKRAEIARNLVDFSYQVPNIDSDPRVQAFFEAWTVASQGTVFVYDGCEHMRRDKKKITSVDPITGEIEWEETTEIVDTEIESSTVPIEELYLWDFYIPSIQKQPKLAWVTYYDEEAFNATFGKYKLAKHVMKGSTEFNNEMESTFFTKEWKNRLPDGTDYEVIRYYNTIKDEYKVIVNGVMLLDAPLLWEYNGRKIVPFAKSIFEPFSDKFAYGNSLPNTVMGDQDTINALWNMSLDKTYRSMIPYLIIGESNRDAFDLEDEEVSLDTKIYVSDVNQVRESQSSGIGAGDAKMLELVGRSLDLTSVDANQQGNAGRGVTAREIVIANENAIKLKGILFMFLQHLWVQKLRLRIVNILMYYTLPKVGEILGEEGESTFDQYRKFTVEGATLSDGSTGMLGMQMVGSEDQLPIAGELDVEEEMYAKQGQKYEAVAFTSDYLDDWHLDVKVTASSLQNSDPSQKQAKFVEKARTLGTFFPQIFQMNQQKLFKDFALAYGEDPDDYQSMIPEGMGAPAAEGQQTNLDSVM